MDTQLIHMYQRNSNEQGPAGRQRPGDGNNGSNGNGPRKNRLARTLIIVGVVLVAWYLFQPFFFQGPNTHGQPVVELPYSSFYQQVMNGNVKDAIFQGQDITGDLKNAVSLTDLQWGDGAYEPVSPDTATQRRPESHPLAEYVSCAVPGEARTRY